jgi:hypothetical protein
MNRSTFFPFFILSAFLCMPGLIAAQETEPIEPSEAHSYFVLEGTIGDSLEVRVFLVTDPGWEEDETERASGYYEYKSIRKPIALWGGVDGEGTMTLDEGVRSNNLDEDEVTGRFEGKLETEGEQGVFYSGVWTSPDGKRQLPFVLEEQ